jgi:hypothetical protein
MVQENSDFGFDLKFEEDKSDHFFVIATKLGHYRQRVRCLTYHWSKQRLFKLGLAPNSVTHEIINAYLKWNKERQQNAQR